MGGICKAESRRKIVVVRVYEGALVQSTVFCAYESPGGRVEVCRLIVSLDGRCGELIPDPVIEREFPIRLPIVLSEEEVHIL